jgi:hypothetical protein
MTEELRFQCLELAHRACSTHIVQSAEEIIAAAEKFVAFVASTKPTESPTESNPAWDAVRSIA